MSLEINEKVKDILEWIICIIVAVGLALLIRYYVGTSTIVQQHSMYPTLKPDQRLILSRLDRTMKKMPERGDIITFEAPSETYISQIDADLNNPVAIYDNEQASWFGKFRYNVLEIGKISYIKRVIGLPGDHVVIKDGKVYINDQELEEPYLQPGVVTDVTNGVFSDIVVPENYVFAMGDNRTQSSDCRRFGCIPLDKIEGKVVLRFWPLNVFGKVE